tara:strand:- start:1945 stop:3048 length:1104 start_codon:yes stop_codon:yes gene_type:complete
MADPRLSQFVADAYHAWKRSGPPLLVERCESGMISSQQISAEASALPPCTAHGLRALAASTEMPLPGLLTICYAIGLKHIDATRGEDGLIPLADKTIHGVNAWVEEAFNLPLTELPEAGMLDAEAVVETAVLNQPFIPDLMARIVRRSGADAVDFCIDLAMALLSPNVKFDLDNVRVGDAGVMGRGVFATRALERGDVATLWTTYMVGLPFRGDRVVLQTRSADAQQVADEWSSLVPTYGIDLCNSSREEPLFQLRGVGDPREDTPSACAHIINDGARMVDQPNYQLKYLIASNAKLNCQLAYVKGLSMAVVARPIESDAQLFVMYGNAYWTASSQDAETAREYLEAENRAAAHGAVGIRPVQVGRP